MKIYVANNKLYLFKNNFFKYILVFILFFGIFIFSCKHDIQQPEVKQTTEAILSVDEAQKWFEAQPDSAITLKSGRVGKSLELKNDWRYARESQNDTLGVVDVDILAKGRFSFLDNDGKRVFENTGNEKYLNSLSRLVVQKNKKNGRIESFVMTLIASPEYLEKQNFDLTKSTYLKRLKDFTGLVLYYSVSGEFVNGWKYAQGKVIGKGSQTVANNSPLVLKKAECVCVTVTMYNQFCTDWFDMRGHYIFTNCEARTTDYEFYYLFCAYISDSDGNSNGGGGSGGGYDGDYNPPPVPDPIPLNIKAIANNVNLSTPDQTTLSDALVYLNNQDCLSKAVYNSIANSSLKINFKIAPPGSADGAYDPKTKTISFLSSSNITPATLKEELFHAYQDSYYPNGTSQYIGTGRVNIEFEAKLYQDIMFYNADCCSAFKQIQPPVSVILSFSDWVTAIRLNSFPITQADYANYLGLFNQYNPKYSSAYSPNLKLPASLISILSTSGCYE